MTKKHYKSQTLKKEIHKEQVAREHAMERFTELREGHLPSNNVVLHGIERLDKQLSKNDELSPSGTQVNEDIRNILQTLKDIVADKNRGDVIQHFVFHSAHATINQSNREKLFAIRKTFQETIDKEKTVISARENISCITMLVKLMIISSKFREFVYKGITFCSLLYKDSSSHRKKASKKVPIAIPEGFSKNVILRHHKNNSSSDDSPDSEEKEKKSPKIDEIHEESKEIKRSIDTIVKTEGPNKTKEDEKTIKKCHDDINKNIDHIVDSEQNEQYIAENKVDKSAKKVKDGLEDDHSDKQESTTTTTTAKEKEKEKNSDEMYVGEWEPEYNDVVTDAELAELLEAGYSSSEHTEDDDEDNEEAFEEKKKKREAELTKHFVEWLQQLHERPECVNSLLYLTNTIIKAKTTWEQQTDVKKIELLTFDDEAHKHHKFMQLEAKQMLENWVGHGYSADRLTKLVKELKTSIAEDQELRELLEDITTVATASVKDVYYMSSAQIGTDCEELIHRMQAMLKGKYRRQFKELHNELRFVTDAIQNDSTLKKVKKQITVLERHMFLNEDGLPVLKPELFTDTRTILFSFLECIQYVPLPPFYHSDEKLVLQIENIVIETSAIMPEDFELIAKMVKIDGKAVTSFKVHISKVFPRLRSVNFHLDKRKGFPKIKARGLADIDILGKSGMTIEFTIIPNTKIVSDRVYSVFTVRDVSCKIGKIRIRLRDTSHDVLYNLLSPVTNVVCKKHIETAVTERVAEIIEKINQFARRQATVVLQAGDSIAVKAQRKEMEERGFFVIPE